MTRRAPNQQLERLFRETGWTLERFGREVNKIATERGTPTRYGPQSAHQWINNGVVPKQGTPALVLEALARELGRPITYSDAGFPNPVKEVSETPSTAEGLIELGTKDMDPSRRSVLGATLFSVALTVPNWVDVVGRMEAVQSGRMQHIGTSDVDTVIAMTGKIHELDDQFGGRAARPMAAAFLVNTVAPYLRAEAPESTRKSMMSAASDLCFLTGYMANDEGLHGLAQQYYVKALKLAGAAEEHLVYCRTLRGMSVQAGDLGHARPAAMLADAAAEASPNAGPRLRAYIAGQQAWSSAQIKNRKSAIAYLREAERALDKAESRETLARSYGPSALAVQESHVRYEFGDIRGSVKYLEQSQQLCHPVYRRTRVRQGAMLAERQLQLGHLEAACDTWGKVLDEYPLVQSGRCDERISHMFMLIKPHLKNHVARELHERASTVTRMS